MAIKSALWGLGGAIALMGLMSSAAFAGHEGAHAYKSSDGPVGCGVVMDCQTGLELVRGPVGHSGPMTVESRTPYDYFDSIHFQRAPHVSVTRIHGMMPSADIKDAPVAFHGDCHPESTVYCRQGQGKPVNVTLNAPAQRQPFIAPPPAPVMQAPIVQAPVPTERVVAIGGGYDPSKFAPRIYGDPYTITPGIAHVPTSIVDRDPVRAQAVLDSGQAAPNPWTPGGTTPALAGAPMSLQAVPPVMAPRPMMAAPVMPVPVMPAPVMQRPLMHGPIMGSIPTGFPGAAGAPILQPNGTYASRVGADGTYWEKVSGPTVVGGLNATQVICKRKLPTQSVNPIVGAPYPMAEPACDLPPHLAQYESRPRGRY